MLNFIQNNRRLESFQEPVGVGPNCRDERRILEQAMVKSKMKPWKTPN